MSCDMESHFNIKTPYYMPMDSHVIKYPKSKTGELLTLSIGLEQA